MSNIDSDLIRGNIDTIILKTLLDGDKYGLDIIKEVEQRSNGTYELKQPTLYSCLKRLENQELISSYWLDSDIGGRRHYYKLSEKGRETLQKKQEEWMKSKFIIDNLLSNFNSDEYRLVKKDDYDRIIEGKQFAYENNLSSAPEQKINDSQEETVEDESMIEEDEVDSTEDFVEDESETQEFEDEYEDLLANEVVEEDDVDETRPVVDYSNSEGNLHRLVSQYANFDIPSEYLNQTESDNEEETQTTYSSAPEFFDEEDETEESSDDITTNIHVDLADENYEDVFDDEDETDLDKYENFFTTNEEDETEESFEDDHVYYTHTESRIDEEETQRILPDKDQTAQEFNALNFLRRQEDEEINTYVGDKNSYINHLNLTSEEVVQQNLLDLGVENDISSFDETINKLKQATEELHNFGSSYEYENDDELTVNFSQNEDYGIEIDKLDNLIEIADEHLDCNCHQDSQDEFVVYQEDEDNFLAELSELNRPQTSGFFNSTDRAEYNTFSAPTIQPQQFEDYSEYDSADASIETDDALWASNYEESDDEESEVVDELENDYVEYNYSESENEVDENDNIDETDVVETPTYNYSAFDSIISKTASDYTEENTKYLNETFEPFTPRYTSENYKQKLSNLSAYSKIGANSITEETVSSEQNTQVIEKVKDIKSLKSEFEEEGIKIKEYKRHNINELAEKNYLLSNKINMVRSLILLFGYVFILSAVYIILNSTNMKQMEGFSFVWFIYGFIPFIAYASYHTAMYLINPYKKSPAKYAPRIMLFISFIITIQLLLITYCINLQLGFYSFTQSFYNHLYWIIPTIISFAPIVSNLIYISLFYSKNFNV